MVIPLHDDNPTTSQPYVTVAIMIACALVYIWQHWLLPAAETQAVANVFGLVPAVLTGVKFLPTELAQVPPVITVFTSMFLHGGFWHLAGNMLYLWIFGNNIEDAMGHVRFFIFYLLCGVAAVAAQVLPDPASTIPMVGASGAISGVLGAYMLLFPRARVLLGVPLGFLILQIGRYAARAPGDTQGGIAFGAHIGGFIAGCALVTVFKKRDVPLWRRT
jgi:membrane associated rhomboid family serine protease